jgi:hypothetical protein
MEKGIKAYHSYLNLCNTEEVLPETVREDLNMNDWCEQVDYTSSLIVQTAKDALCVMH